MTVNPNACSPEHIRRLAEPFFEQGEPVVFIARCCGWVYAGTQPVAECKKCRKAPTSYECTSIEAALAHADP